jgi:hypothetical protein
MRVFLTGAVGEEGVALCDIAEVIGAGLKEPG